MKTKVLFFCSQLGSGGAEMQLLRLLNNLDKKKFECLLVVSRGDGSYEALLDEHVQVIHLETGQSSSNTWRLIKAVPPLAKAIEYAKPDIVCSFMDRPNVALMAAVEKLKNKPKTVLCVQNNPVYKYVERTSVLNRWVFHLMKKYYPKADKIVPLSYGVFEELKKLIPSVSEKSTVIHNAGFDDSLFPKLEEPLHEYDTPDVPLMIACGRLVEQKGYPYLFEALAKVAEDQAFELWILGMGPLEERLKDLRSKLNLTDQIKFLGFQNNPYKFMAAGDLFVLSSLWEGFGNVVVEAMISGTAVVSTNCPYGPGEIIEHGESGYLVPVANADALADAIVEVIKNKNLRSGLAEKGQKRAKEFSAEINARKYVGVFSNLV